MKDLFQTFSLNTERFEGRACFNYTAKMPSGSVANEPKN